MEDLSTTMEISNLDDFKKLLAKAEAETEMLKEDLIRISSFTFQTKQK